MAMIKMRFYLAVEKVLRYPAVFFVRLHRLASDRTMKVMNTPQVHELLIRRVLRAMERAEGRHGLVDMVFGED